MEGRDDERERETHDAEREHGEARALGPLAHLGRRTQDADHADGQHRGGEQLEEARPRVLGVGETGRLDHMASALRQRDEPRRGERPEHRVQEHEDDRPFLGAELRPPDVRHVHVLDRRQPQQSAAIARTAKTIATACWTISLMSKSTNDANTASADANSTPNTSRTGIAITRPRTSPPCGSGPSPAGQQERRRQDRLRHGLRAARDDGRDGHVPEAAARGERTRQQDERTRGERVQRQEPVARAQDEPDAEQRRRRDQDDRLRVAEAAARGKTRARDGDRERSSDTDDRGTHGDVERDAYGDGCAERHRVARLDELGVEVPRPARTDARRFGWWLREAVVGAVRVMPPSPGGPAVSPASGAPRSSGSRSAPRGSP